MKPQSVPSANHRRVVLTQQQASKLLHQVELFNEAFQIEQEDFHQINENEYFIVSCQFIKDWKKYAHRRKLQRQWPSKMNADILDKKGQLKPNLKKGEDYEIISYDLFKLFANFQGMKIKRECIMVDQTKMVPLYIKKFGYTIISRQDLRNIHSKQRYLSVDQISISEYHTIQDLQKLIIQKHKQMLKFSELRFWKIGMKDSYYLTQYIRSQKNQAQSSELMIKFVGKPINTDKTYVQDLGFDEGEFLVVEMKQKQENWHFITNLEVRCAQCHRICPKIKFICYCREVEYCQKQCKQKDHAKHQLVCRLNRKTNFILPKTNYMTPKNSSDSVGLQNLENTQILSVNPNYETVSIDFWGKDGPLSLGNKQKIPATSKNTRDSVGLCDKVGVSNLRSTQIIPKASYNPNSRAGLPNLGNKQIVPIASNSARDRPSLQNQGKKSTVSKASNHVKGRVGLSNLGNTCYMNSCLQCLSNTKELREYFLEGNFEQEINLVNQWGTKGQLSKAFANFIKEIWIESNKIFCPSQIKQIVGSVDSMFENNQQHDAQEFFSFMVDKIHEDLNRIEIKPQTIQINSYGRTDDMIALESWINYTKRNQSIIVDLMTGQYLSQIICPTCMTRSVTVDAFTLVSLPIPAIDDPISPSITSCLQKFKSTEQFEVGAEWFCPHCKEKKLPQRRISIYKAPKILVFQIKRFGERNEAGNPIKNRQFVKITQQLNMKNYIVDPTPMSSYIQKMKQRYIYVEPRTKKPIIASSQPLYELYAVIDHQGDYLSSGHYIASAKHEEKWFQFNDSNVEECSQNFLGVDAYLFFYRRKDQ